MLATSMRGTGTWYRSSLFTFRTSGEETGEVNIESGCCGSSDSRPSAEQGATVSLHRQGTTSDKRITARPEKSNEAGQQRHVRDT